MKIVINHKEYTRILKAKITQDAFEFARLEVWSDEAIDDNNEKISFYIHETCIFTGYRRSIRNNEYYTFESMPLNYQTQILENNWIRREAPSVRSLDELFIVWRSSDLKASNIFDYKPQNFHIDKKNISDLQIIKNKEYGQILINIKIEYNSIDNTISSHSINEVLSHKAATEIMSRWPDSECQLNKHIYVESSSIDECKVDDKLTQIVGSIMINKSVESKVIEEWALNINEHPTMHIRLRADISLENNTPLRPKWLPNRQYHIGDIVMIPNRNTYEVASCKEAHLSGIVPGEYWELIETSNPYFDGFCYDSPFGQMLIREVCKHLLMKQCYEEPKGVIKFKIFEDIPWNIEIGDNIIFENEKYVVMYYIKDLNNQTIEITGYKIEVENINNFECIEDQNIKSEEVSFDADDVRVCVRKTSANRDEFIIDFGSYFQGMSRRISLLGDIKI